ncbi:DUF5995 family protein [Micromonospora sagamiensis]|uniref:Uncharacterized protein n=1 Tax=Micromonospora sagamiensis TaxID=47875 RepID=A0A562WHK0_9ACTN|nr:DUF5995 family protein [Micromonospora sagamiensis]TWJ29357.1 hypothetical protein JD81_02867 [Micromonospora sagamiensis]BCL17616.1 hypothetical protein GCM10017556_53550 [Micromonospora sagamiensis]
MTEAVWGPVHQDVADLLAHHPADVPAVVDHLTKLQDVLVRLPPLQASCPLADFNGLYLTITGKVLERLYDGRFADPVFLSRLDVEFAARYFDALRLWTESSPYTPQAWSCIFERMQGPDVRPLPAAAAGVNAHINFDLPFALVTTFDHLESEPVDGGDQHRDYLQINAIFAESIPTLRRGYLDRWQLIIDTLNGDLDDWYQGELVEYTRGVAWRNAQRIWRVRHDTHAREGERDRLDGTAARLGRLLLSPLGALLQ